MKKMTSSGFFLLLHALKKGHYVDMKKIVLLMATMLGALGIMTSCEDNNEEEQGPEKPLIEEGYKVKGVIGSDSVDAEQWGTVSHAISNATVMVKDGSLPLAYREKTVEWNLQVSLSDNKQSTMHLHLTNPRTGITYIKGGQTGTDEPNGFNMEVEQPGHYANYAPTADSPLRMEIDKVRLLEYSNTVKRGKETVTALSTGYIIDGAFKGTLVNKYDTSDSLAVDFSFSLVSF